MYFFNNFFNNKENINNIDSDYELARKIQKEEIERTQKGKGKEEEDLFEHTNIYDNPIIENINNIDIDYEIAKLLQREELEGIQNEKGKGKEENTYKQTNINENPIIENSSTIDIDYEIAKQLEIEEIIRTQEEEKNSNKISLDYELAKQIEREEIEKMHKEEKDVLKQTKKCEICLEDFSLLDGTNYFLNCNCIIHNTCFDNMVKVAIESNNLPVKCPNCNIPVHPNYVIDSIKNANPDLLEKYEKYSMNNFLMNNNDEFSPCPTPGCEYIFFFRQGEFNFLCPICHKHYCLNCKDEWHDGLTCQQYKDSRDEKKLDDQFFQFARGAKFKMCPQCKYWVEKTRGCNHMRCRCGADFCYSCGDLMNMNMGHTCRRQ